MSCPPARAKPSTGQGEELGRPAGVEPRRPPPRPGQARPQGPPGSGPGGGPLSSARLDVPAVADQARPAMRHDQVRPEEGQPGSGPGGQPGSARPWLDGGDGEERPRAMSLPPRPATAGRGRQPWEIAPWLPPYGPPKQDPPTEEDPERPEENRERGEWDDREHHNQDAPEEPHHGPEASNPPGRNAGNDSNHLRALIRPWTPPQKPTDGQEAWDPTWEYTHQWADGVPR